MLAGITLAVMVGVIWPERGAAMRPLGDGFVKLIKILIAPIVFATITIGIHAVADGADVAPGRPAAAAGSVLTRGYPQSERAINVFA